MSIVELGALGEFVSAFAVLVTLIYLAVQVKATRNAMQEQSFQATTQASTDLSIALLSADPASPHAVAKGVAGEALDDDEATLYRLSLNPLVFQLATIFESPPSKHRDRILANYRSMLDYWWANPNFRKALNERYRNTSPAEFVEFVEGFQLH